MSASIIPSFNNCPALPGYHCQTNSLAKIFHFNNHTLSEEFLLGIGAGMGFIYWHQKGNLPFVGGRGNKNFIADISARTAVIIKEKKTDIAEKAEKDLVNMLKKGTPVMLFGDMCYMPWFNFPDDYHFGGHTFVICGFDGNNRVLISDMNPRMGGLKDGILETVDLETIRKIRSSKYQPFPPKNAWYDFDFSYFKYPSSTDIHSAIAQTCNDMLNAPISNMGIRGMRRTAQEIKKWPKIFSSDMLKMALFNLYIYIEIGGTGGGCFRYMYSRFLKEASTITGNQSLIEIANNFQQSGTLFTEIAMLFKEMDDVSHLEERLQQASEKFLQIAEIEENAFRNLLIIKQN